MTPEIIESSAVISECGAYRYRLVRRWNDQPLLNLLMLNPSKADAQKNDPTITRQIVRATNLGFGGLLVTNMFGYRSTDPRELKRVSDPVGPDNDAHILAAAREAGMVLCAWGNDGALFGRAFKVKQLLKREGIPLYALKVAKTGQPYHPLYLPYELEPVLLEPSLAPAGREGG